MIQFMQEQIIHGNMFHLLVYSPSFNKGGAMPQNETFSDIGATIADNFNVKMPEFGKSFLAFIRRKGVMKLFRMVDVIEKKRNGAALTKEEITFFVNGYTDWFDS